MPDDPPDLATERARLAATLGVDTDCSEAELRDVYKQLARIHHPDHGGDAHFMSVLSEAYQELLALPLADPSEERKYSIDAGWTGDPGWGEETAPETFGLGAATRVMVSLAVLPAIAVVFVLLAFWFITAIN